MPEYSYARRVQYLGLAVVLVVSSLGTGACKAGKKKRKPKSIGVTTTQTSPAVTPPANAPVQADNGLAGKPPRAIIAQASAALRGATFLHARGSMKDGRDLIGVDMTFSRRGGAAKGRIRGPISGKNVMLEAVVLNGKAYLRGRQFWLAVGGQAAVQRMGSKWIVVPGTQQPAGGDLSLTGFAKLLRPKGRLVKLQPTTIGGQRVIRVMDMSDRSVRFIAATGKPYPLRIMQRGGRPSLDFDRFDVPIAITRPTNVVSRP